MEFHRNKKEQLKKWARFTLSYLVFECNVETTLIGSPNFYLLNSPHAWKMIVRERALIPSRCGKSWIIFDLSDSGSWWLVFPITDDKAFTASWTRLAKNGNWKDRKKERVMIILIIRKRPSANVLIYKSILNCSTTYILAKVEVWVIYLLDLIESKILKKYLTLIELWILELNILEYVEAWKTWCF